MSAVAYRACVFIKVLGGMQVAQERYRRLVFYVVSFATFNSVLVAWHHIVFAKGAPKRVISFLA